MGFFSSTTSVGTGNIEDLLNDDSLDIKENLNLMEAAYAYAAENEMNWNGIMEAAAMTELEYFSSTGQEYVYTNESGFFENIVNFFKKIWEKIKSIFKKFMAMIGSLLGKDKDFSKKHGPTIRAAMGNIPSDAEIKGYKFTYEKLEARVKNCGNALNHMLGKIEFDNATAGSSIQLGSKKIELAGDSYDATDATEALRGYIMENAKGASATMTESEMREVAYSECRDDEDSPVDIKIDAGVVGRALSELEGGDKAKSDAAKLYRNTEKIFKEAMKSAETKEKDFYRKTKPTSKDEADAYTISSNVISRSMSLAKTAASNIQILCSIYLQAVKDKYSQDRKICVKVLTYKNVKEGAYVSHTSEGAYFTNVNLI